MATKLSIRTSLPLLAIGALLAGCIIVPLASAAPDARDEGGMAQRAPDEVRRPIVQRPTPNRLDFDRDVRPILSENCFACHGFDANKRMAGLRLDTEQGAHLKLASGRPAVVPGKPEESSLVKRVASGSMPPPASGKKLTPAQVATLRRWVEQGGRYAQHWAFVPPARPPVPAVRDRRWLRNPVDNFILARLEREGLRPSPPADRVTLIRRLSFDLRGLPPTLAEVNEFLADRLPGAYERLVDRFLASPHYGERMALQWLDLARYADTHGYHIDSHRDMWPWRDWVIQAFNRNLPYDRFTIEQLAGDLLPGATLDQKIATGFNRNHPINFEGGAIPEEYQAAYIFDRIDTTSTVWMGLTLRCAQCHDHKYDPLTQKDFYKFYAFFHNVPEKGLDGQTGNAAPFLKAPSAEQQARLAEYDRKVAELESTVKARLAAVVPGQPAWEQAAAARPEGPSVLAANLLAHLPLEEASGEEVRDAAGKLSGGRLGGTAGRAEGRFGRGLSFDGSSYVNLGPVFDLERTGRFSYGAWIYPTSSEAGAILSRMDDGPQLRGWDLYLNGGKAFVHLIHEWDKNVIRVNTKKAMPLNQWHHVLATYDGSGKAKGVRIYVDGKAEELDLTHDTLSGTIRTSAPAFIGRRNPGAPFRGRIDEVRVYDRELSADDVRQLLASDNIREVLALTAEKRTPGQKETLAQYFAEATDAQYRKLSGELAEWRQKRSALDAAIPTTMVMEEMAKPRDTFILVRGEYDRKGERVTAGTPAALPQPAGSDSVNRLALAKWLVDPFHPLTARVAVNRYWQMLFGAGLVKSTENFGTQSERPTHPELLDWLAVRFSQPATSGPGSVNVIRSLGGRVPNPTTQSPKPSNTQSPDILAWDTKALLRLLVTSAAYRQASHAGPALLKRDPENQLLARGPRFRLSAEFVRDQALQVSGLLVPKIGGPSVKPYQPPGLWEEIAFGGIFTAQKYEQDHGEALYRRSMYTFWKRTCPPPSLQTFDAPEREFCIVRRSVSNTPLQSLVLMNDPTYVEASRKFAERIVTEVAAVPKDRLRYAFRLALSRQPRNEEIRLLLSLYEEQLARYRKDPEAAKKLLGVGESKRDEALDAAEVAAWAGVTGVILNMDEMITKN